MVFFVILVSLSIHCKTKISEKGIESFCKIGKCISINTENYSDSIFSERNNYVHTDSVIVNCNGCPESVYTFDLIPFEYAQDTSITSQVSIKMGQTVNVESIMKKVYGNYNPQKRRSHWKANAKLAQIYRLDTEYVNETGAITYFVDSIIFQNENKQTMIVVTKSFWGIDCRSCGIDIGAIRLIYENNHWIIKNISISICEFGRFGSIDHFKIMKIGKENYGFYFDFDDGTSGWYWRNGMMFTFYKNEFIRMFEFTVFKGFGEYENNLIYQVNSKINFKNTHQTWFPMIITSKGTFPKPDYTPMDTFYIIDAVSEYKFENGKYVKN